MLNVKTDDAHGCILAEPHGKLSRENFESLNKAFDAWVDAHGRTPNLVVHAEAFPGWADFASFIDHVQFVRDHHKQMRRIALVSDSAILDVAPVFGQLFLGADVRHFPEGQLEAALEWVGSAEVPAPVTLMSDLPGDVLGIEAHGVVSARDYAEVIVPKVEEMLETHDAIKLLYHFTPDFRAMSAGAMWSDAKLGMMHLTDFTRIAVVADQDFIRDAVGVFAPLVRGEIRVFSSSELGSAREWIGRAG